MSQCVLTIKINKKKHVRSIFFFVWWDVWAHRLCVKRQQYKKPLLSAPLDKHARFPSLNMEFSFKYYAKSEE